jgi:hypothetical protein
MVARQVCQRHHACQNGGAANLPRHRCVSTDGIAVAPRHCCVAQGWRARWTHRHQFLCCVTSHLATACCGRAKACRDERWTHLVRDMSRSSGQRCLIRHIGKERTPLSPRSCRPPSCRLGSLPWSGVAASHRWSKCGLALLNARSAEGTASHPSHKSTIHRISSSSSSSSLSTMAHNNEARGSGEGAHDWS